MPIPALASLIVFLLLAAIDDTQGTVFEAHYLYDDATQITGVTSPTHPKLSVTLGYDDLYRLTSVSGGQSQSFTYTPIGNIETNSKVAGAYQYDANGSRIRRSGPSVGTTHYFGRIAQVEDPGGSPLLTKYYYAGDILVARQQAGAKQFYHQDHRCVSCGPGFRCSRSSRRPAFGPGGSKAARPTLESAGRVISLSPPSTTHRGRSSRRTTSTTTRPRSPRSPRPRTPSCR